MMPARSCVSGVGGGGGGGRGLTFLYVTPASSCVGGDGGGGGGDGYRTRMRGPLV